MDDKLVKKLQETVLFEEDLFPNATPEDIATRLENRYPELKGMTLGTSVKILIEGEKYSQFGEDSGRFKRTLTGSLKAVICKIC